MAIGVDCPNESHYRIVDRIWEACLDEFTRPTGNYRFLVQMVLYSLKKRDFFLENILYKRTALIPEKKAVSFESVMVDLSHGGFKS
jgi:hypothetical protein